MRWKERHPDCAVLQPFGNLGIFEHPDHACLLATPDYFVVRPDGVVELLEIKTTQFWMKEEWLDPNGELRVPPAYYTQVQHQLMVTGLDRAHVALLIGGVEYHEFEVQANRLYQERLLELELEFWDRVTSENAPPVDGSQETALLLARLFPEVAGTQHYDKDGNPDGVIPPHTMLPYEFALLDDEREENRAKIKELTDRNNVIDNQIRQAIGSNQEGWMPHCIYSWKEETRTIKAREESTSTSRVLRRKARK